MRKTLESLFNQHLKDSFSHPGIDWWSTWSGGPESSTGVAVNLPEPRRRLGNGWVLCCRVSRVTSVTISSDEPSLVRSLVFDLRTEGSRPVDERPS